jgi:hypothetical protein
MGISPFLVWFFCRRGKRESRKLKRFFAAFPVLRKTGKKPLSLNFPRASEEGEQFFKQVF